ncbi:MAG: hypothetical protein MO846_12290 [Candidatus Devosia symbiotica]|nr:hypothetical protein [Candidatus Devosia symbiotica]
MPERFTFQIVGADQLREVEKRWQVGADLGVEYREYPPMSATTEFAAKMVELSTAFARRTFDDANELEATTDELSQGDEAGAQRADPVSGRIQYLRSWLADGFSTFGLVVLEKPACELEAGILDAASAKDISVRTGALAAAIRHACGQTADKTVESNVAP